MALKKVISHYKEKTLYLYYKE